jgi:hypothetical protein
LTGTLEEKILKRKNEILDYSKNLKEQIGRKPSIDLTVQSLRKEVLKVVDDLRSYFKMLQRNLCTDTLQNCLKPRKFDSLTIKSEADQDMLKKLISEKPSKLTILYRGSRDGFKTTDFHSKVDQAERTISVIESNYGKVFGGYSDQPWSGHGWKKSESSFIFSISDKEKYGLTKKQNLNAVYCHSASGVTFGSGHKIFIANSCNNNAESHSNTDNTYENKGKPKEALAGAYNFTVKEIEVLKVE